MPPGDRGVPGCAIVERVCPLRVRLLGPHQELEVGLDRRSDLRAWGYAANPKR